MNQQLNRLPFKDRTIEKIRDAMLVDRVIQYCKGTVELTNGQLTAHLKLLDKVLPSLKQVESNITIDHNSLSIHDLNGRLASLGHNSLNNNKIIDIKPEPIIQSEPTNQTVDKIESIEQSD